MLTDRAGVVAARVTEEHVLDVLALKNILDGRMVAAALRLKADYHAAATASSATGSYSGISNMRDFSSAQRERSDSEEAAYKRWRKPLATLVPRQGAGVIVAVCHNIPPSLRDISFLQKGLDRLAQYYGIMG